MSSAAVGCSPESLVEALRVVKRGGVVALPYERLFGLAANALDPDAVSRVAAIKVRNKGKERPGPISVIAPDMESVLSIADDFTPLAFRLSEKYWPGPLTILVRARFGLPPALVGPTGLVGVRVAGPCPAAELADRSKLILTATSANRHGEEDALCREDVVGLEGVDLITGGRVPGPPGSTVVDASKERPIVIRPGCIVLEEVI